MPYQIKWERSGSFVVCSGVLSLDELHEANGHLHGHEGFGDHSYQIWDLLHADMSGIAPREMRQPAATDSVAARYAPEMKVALVVTDAHARALCEAYREGIGRMGSKWACRLFETMEEAREWVGA